jgi:hypothetical protein
MDVKSGLRGGTEFEFDGPIFQKDGAPAHFGATILDE